MGEVLPQGNPPKSLQGQPRTPVRLRAHEKAQRWNQCPGDRHREEKGDDVGSEVRVKMLEKQVKAIPTTATESYHHTPQSFALKSTYY